MHLLRRRFLPFLAVVLGFLAAPPEGPAWAAGLDATFGIHDAGSTTAVDHGAWTELLATHVKVSPDGVNRVDYAALKASGRDKLSAYLKALEAVDVAKLNRAEQFAYWANLYNAKTVDIILDHYPVSSIKKINLGGSLLSSFSGGPWDAQVVTVKGQKLSLNDIEHKIMRPVFEDPRIHYAVNCASIGCPNLGTEAFTAGKLEAQLDAAARAYVNHPRGVAVSGSGVRASTIYKWYVEDFGDDAAGVLAHLRAFAEPALAEKLAAAETINGYDYDWSINDAPR